MSHGQNVTAHETLNYLHLYSANKSVPGTDGNIISCDNSSDGGGSNIMTKCSY